MARPMYNIYMCVRELIVRYIGEASNMANYPFVNQNIFLFKRSRPTLNLGPFIKEIVKNGKSRTHFYFTFPF